MRRLTMILGAMVLGLMPVAAFAAPPTQAQKALFMRECMLHGTTTLCTCKADVAMKIIDSDFMAIVLKAMVSTLPVQYSHDYAVYISQSNAVCAPGM